MNMHPVKSSDINMIGYDEQTHKMRVSFRRKKPVDYCYVPEDVFSAFLNARSKNHFYKRHIENDYQC
ncbi:MAG: KTSC domain-containing protein [Methylomarinum sp.]|nr:KTSC domain-containing protein [Methylomarinum sp.]